MKLLKILYCVSSLLFVVAEVVKHYPGVPVDVLVDVKFFAALCGQMVIVTGASILVSQPESTEPSQLPKGYLFRWPPDL